MTHKSIHLAPSQPRDANATQFLEMRQKTISDDPVAILQPSGHIYYCNNAFLDMVGSPSQNIYTRHLFDFLHREDAQPVLDQILSLMSTPQQKSTESKLRIKSAQGRYCEKNVAIKLVKQQSQIIGIKIKFLNG